MDYLLNRNLNLFINDFPCGLFFTVESVGAENRTGLASSSASITSKSFRPCCPS